MPNTTFDATYRKQIKELWLRFQHGEDVSQEVRPTIYQSWLRCRELLVPPDKIKRVNLPQEKFKQICKRENELINVARPILERIFLQVRHQECLIDLADKDGIILIACVNKWINIENGVKVSEKIIGTAGIPTCLQTGSSLIVYGAEHFCIPNHEIVCVSSPIYDENKKIIGAVSMSSSIDTFHSYEIAIIQEASHSISEQLRLRHLLARENALIESFGEGLLVVNGKGNILRFNAKAQSLLKIGNSELFPKLDDFFQSSEINNNIINGIPFTNEELRLCNERSPSAQGNYCVLSFTPTEDGGVITVRPVLEMHAYAARTVGLKTIYHFDDILGTSHKIRACVEVAKKMAASNYTILLLGESGTGKELFAQSIHNASSRKNKPFIAVNCGALPRELVQSELFGYAEGAFTGALRQGNPGKFELADGGTLFLDEVGEMSLDAQISLLRLIQNKEVTRVGGKTTRHVDVRIIAATNRDLLEEVRQKNFREDLYFRLNVFSLRIPSLHERSEDVPELAKTFLSRMLTQNTQLQPRSFSAEALAELQSRPWIGNVRELEHTVERALFMSSGPIIFPEDLDPIQEKKIENSPSPCIHTLGTSEDYATIDKALRQCGGHVDAAAKILGISRTTLYTRLTQYSIRAKDYRRLKICEIS